MTHEELRHLALNMLATNYITPREMELNLARAFLALSEKFERMEKVVEAARTAHICDGDFQDESGDLQKALAALEPGEADE